MAEPAGAPGLPMLREIELKAVVDSIDRSAAALERAGGRLVFRGQLEDQRYDTPERSLAARDEVLRLRIYRSDAGSRAELGWKGPTGYDGGYKVRDELAAGSSDPAALAKVLDRLGYVVTRAIERQIVQYELEGATVRFERYPRMDDLVEVEGEPEAIERAIVALGMARTAFTSERLPDFVRRFEARTGERAALCEAERFAPGLFSLDDA